MALFEEPFGIGYPAKDAVRKMEDTAMLKSIQLVSKTSMIDLLNALDKQLVNRVFKRQNVVEYVLSEGKVQDIIQWIKSRHLCRERHGHKFERK